MPKLNPISPRKMVKILLSIGYEEKRIKGSHHLFYNTENKRSATVPIHGNRDLGVGILKEILRDIELSVSEFDKLRRKR